ncbi:MAG: hypothetical protein CL932_03945 [Deltaproteobacteria bacterium]|nr:hypothetical protein [Deltaproteobacteria bacterium]
MYSGGHKARPYKITTKHTTTSGGQYRLSSQRSIAQTTYAVVICFIHFATTPSTNLSIPLSLRLFPLPLHPLEEEGGPIKRYTRDFGFCACEKPPQSERTLVQLPLRDLRSAPVGKGSDAHQTIYRDK